MQSLLDSSQPKFAPNKPESEEEEEDYYQVKKAPMMMLLPGTRPSADTPPQSPTKKLSDALSHSTNNETEEESEYTYETEEEEEEDIQENGIFPPDLESYEIKAERVLEEQRERVSIAPVLDYIDEEDEDEKPQVNSPKDVFITSIIRM